MCYLVHSDLKPTGWAVQCTYLLRVGQCEVQVVVVEVDARLHGQHHVGFQRAAEAEALVPGQRAALHALASAASQW